MSCKSIPDDHFSILGKERKSNTQEQNKSTRTINSKQVDHCSTTKMKYQYLATR